MGMSVGFLIGLNDGECGYCCQAGKTSKSFGIWAYSLTVEQYQLMIDLGWRRSGKYLYKPSIDLTCCPSYTIRLDTHKFKPSKSQLKVLRKMQKFLLDGTGVTMGIGDEGREEESLTDLVAPRKDKSESPSSAIPPDYGIAHMRPGLVDMKSIPLNRSIGISHMIDLIENPTTASTHHLNVRLDPSMFSQEVFELYRKYQIAIHHDVDEELTEDKFTRFLVDSPLRNSKQYGSFHQKYYLDGCLIAVAFLDVLPNCVSSVYFVYDPKYKDLSLGTYSALREIGTTFLLSDQYPSIKYYYLGEIRKN